jgi:fucose permease
MIAAGSVGGMLIPLLQGALLEGVGAQGLAQVVVVDTFLMLLLLGIFRLTDRQQKEMPVAQSISASPGAE